MLIKSAITYLCYYYKNCYQLTQVIKVKFIVDGHFFLMMFFCYLRINVQLSLKICGSITSLNNFILFFK